MKDCSENQIRNPKTGRCVLKSTPLGKQILKDMSSRSRRSSPRRVSSSPRRASPRKASPKKEKPCKTDQVRNPKTGRCVLKTSPKGKEIIKGKDSSPRRVSSLPRRPSPRRVSSSPRRASPSRLNSPKKQKPCRTDQVRNPKTGRCVLKSSPKGKEIMKATRDSAIYDIRQSRQVYSLDAKKSKEYINNKVSQDSINNILKKYKQKLGLVIENQTDYENFLRIKDIENNIGSLDLHQKISYILENFKPLEKLKNLQSLNLRTHREYHGYIEKFAVNLNLKNLKINNIETISIDKLLKMMEKCEDLWFYEYYDGLQIGMDGVSYLIPDDGEYLLDYQNKIFEKMQSLDNLISFGYTSRFASETDYSELFVNNNLIKLRISHMRGINTPSQLGNIKELETHEFKSVDIEKLPKSLEIIEISLEVETEDEYNEVIKYFEDNNIEYDIDDYYDYRPE